MTGFKFQSNHLDYCETETSEPLPAFEEAEKGRFPWWLFWVAVIVGLPAVSIGAVLLAHWIAAQSVNSIDLSQAFIGGLSG